MKINFYLKNKDSKDETPIEFVVQYRFIELNEAGQKLYKKIKRSTGLSIKPKFWNDKAKNIRETYEKHIEYNQKLKDIENCINEAEKELLSKETPITIDLIKNRLDLFFKGDQSNKPLNLLEFASFIIENKGANHKLMLNQTIRVLKEFSEVTKYRIDYDTINFDFFTAFSEYMNTAKFIKKAIDTKKPIEIKGFSKNTKAKHLSNVKYFMNEALKRKLHTNLDFKTSDFKIKKERIENIYLSDTEIEKLYNLNLTMNPRLEKVRDLFLIGCYTGLRFSDFTQILKENISDFIISIKTQKTGKYVKIPLRPEAKAILDKYNGTIPKAISNQKMNDYLKELGKLAEINEPVLKYKSQGTGIYKETFNKYQLICTHTARRSFATNCYKAGIPTKQIMLITGHSTESEFFKYIQINESENAEMLLNHTYFMPKMKVV